MYPYRKKRARPAVKKDTLQAIWRENGRLPNMSRLERQNGGRLIRFFLILITFFGLLAAISWIGLYLTGSGGQNEGVEVSIEAPQEANNFDQIDIKIHYQNNDRLPLASASLSLRLPPEIQALSSEPTTELGNLPVWNLGTVEAKEKNVITLKGQVVGILGSTIPIQATLTYKPANFNSDFQTVTDASVTIKESPLELAINTKEETVPGETVDLELNYKNTGLAPINNIRLNFITPPSFLIKTAEPPLQDDQSVEVKELGAGEEKKVKIKGAFSSEAEGNYEFALQIKAIADEKDYLLKETKKSITVARGNLTIRLFVNERAEDQQVRLGDELKFRLDLDNKGSGSVSNAVIQLTTDSPLLDFNKLTGDKNSGQEDGLLIWGKKAKPQLTKIESGQRVSLNFSAPIVTKVKNETGSALKLVAKAVIPALNDGEPPREISSQEITLKIASDLQLFSSARYFADDKTILGVGPLPPTVGKETRYRLIWQLTNSFHDLTNLKVSATLPDNVQFEGKKTVSVGNISFNPEKRNVEWQIDKLSIGSKKPEAQFEVSVTPVESQRGQMILLLGDSLVEATDTVLKTTIVSRAGALNSNLEGDKYGEGKGIVK